MPTLAPPQKYFGYAPKPYEDYFPTRKQYSTPPDPDPYGQLGAEERKFEAQKMVQQYLGEMDALAASRRERALRQEFAPQIDALQREELKKKFSGIGAQDRTTQIYERLKQVNPATPEGKMEFSKAYASAATPEEQRAILDAAIATFNMDWNGGRGQVLKERTAGNSLARAFVFNNRTGNVNILDTEDQDRVRGRPRF